MEPEDIMFSKICQTHKDKNVMFSYMEVEKSWPECKQVINKIGKAVWVCVYVVCVCVCVCAGKGGLDMISVWWMPM
jgi:hypothetical protein